jgi:hypothetical protein
LSADAWKISAGIKQIAGYGHRIYGIGGIGIPGRCGSSRYAQGSNSISSLTTDVGKGSSGI